MEQAKESVPQRCRLSGASVCRTRPRDRPSAPGKDLAGRGLVTRARRLCCSLASGLLWPVDEQAVGFLQRLPWSGHG